MFLNHQQIASTEAKTLYYTSLNQLPRNSQEIRILGIFLTN